MLNVMTLRDVGSACRVESPWGVATVCGGGGGGGGRRGGGGGA